MNETGTSVGRTVAEFEALIRSHDRSIRAVAYRLVGDDVDDVLQQAYLKAYREWPRFRGESSFSTWMHRIAYTTALDHLRSRRRRDAVTHRLRPGSDDSDPAQSAVDHVALEQALAELPPDQRTALLLVDGQGMSYADVAAVVGVAEGTIASRLTRARSAMRVVLSRGGQP
jgi:RNA polymerase sigma-70 factor (ECF subfamily)